LFVKASVTYNEQVTVPASKGTENLPVFVIGYTSTTGDGGRVTIDGQSTRSYCITRTSSDNNYVWVNFICEDATADGFHGLEASNSAINCVSRNNGAEGFSEGREELRHICESYGNTGVGIETDRSGQVTFCYSHDNNHGYGNNGGNTFYMAYSIADTNTGNGYNWGSAFDDYLFVNCIFYNNSVGCEVQRNSYAQVFINCSFVDNTTAIAQVSGSSTYVLSTIWNCHYHGNTTNIGAGIQDREGNTGDSARGFNFVTGDPKWSDPANGDFTPAADSPLVGAGIPGAFLSEGVSGQSTGYTDIGPVGMA
jgi:hypothetical protein